MGALDKIWKDKNVTVKTKVLLVKTMVFPKVLYGAESWTVKKRMTKKLDSFELWCWRRVLKVSWKDRKTNEWIVENVKSEMTLESRGVKSQLTYFGHTIRANGIEKEIMLGLTKGRRQRGRPRLRWMGNITFLHGANLVQLVLRAQDRDSWRRQAMEVARDRTRLDATR